MSYRVWIIGCIMVMLTACSTTSKLPGIDDAYYWPPVLSSSNSGDSRTVTHNPSPVNDKIEYLNVQDTTVTIRIKK